MSIPIIPLPTPSEIEAMQRIQAWVTPEQKEFLQLLIHEDAADSLGGKGLGAFNAIQWCIDACMGIEKKYGVDACYVSFYDIREPEHNPAKP